MFPPPPSCRCGIAGKSKFQTDGDCELFSRPFFEHDPICSKFFVTNDTRERLPYTALGVTGRANTWCLRWTSFTVQVPEGGRPYRSRFRHVRTEIIAALWLRARDPN